MASENGPYLNAALICEKMLRETDGVLSPIRIIDRYTLNVVTQGAEPTDIPRPTFSFCLFVSFRGGAAQGTHLLTIRIERPDGLRRDMASSSLYFEPGERGTNLVAELTVTFEIDGLYWFEVFLADQFVTKLPLRILTIRQQNALQSPLGPPEAR